MTTFQLISLNNNLDVLCVPIGLSSVPDRCRPNVFGVWTPASCNTMSAALTWT